jgi:hypothetical protein
MTQAEPDIITRVAYGLTQLPRVAWYLGHGLALRRLAEAARRNGAKPRRRTNAPVPERSQLYAGYFFRTSPMSNPEFTRFRSIMMAHYSR